MKGSYRDELLDVNKKKDTQINPSELNLIENFSDLKSFVTNKGIKFDINTALNINKTTDVNWVDIEMDFYDVLVKYFKESGRLGGFKKISLEKVSMLNEDFDFLKGELVSYLKLINNNITYKNTSEKFQNNFDNIFFEPINLDEIFIENALDNSSFSEQPEQFCFLDFNYTSTLQKYFSKIDQRIVKSDLHYIKIHGDLSDTKNPIIFGFGDEMDSHYKQIEDLKENSYLEHMKSFMYSKTSNYHKLIRFISSGTFQVYILGHSCGISDRIMFNRIFEAPNCLSIKIFFHQINDNTDDYKIKRFDIARHFTNKTRMLEKIVSRDKSVSMNPR